MTDSKINNSFTVYMGIFKQSRTVYKIYFWVLQRVYLIICQND